MQFIDYAKIYVKAGDGGRGCVSFRREKYVPRGGPDGGDGGRGGNIVIRASQDLNTLLDLRYRHEYRAKRGGHGKGKNMHGSDAEDLIIAVPVGTVVKDEGTGHIIADLDHPGTGSIVARGGRGGLGNSHFATPTRQAPRFAQGGETGEEKSLVMELKLLADVGLIGMPNAGKSMLISVISSSRPKIADYPFTTLVPNLGVVKLGNFRSYVVADIPGLIGGAHKGIGLGFQFLRHVERTSLLLHLVDVSLGPAGDSVENMDKINIEIGLYNEELLRKPQIVVATKCDIADEEKLGRLATRCREGSIDFFAISSLTGMGVKDLLMHVSMLLEGTGNKKRGAIVKGKPGGHVLEI
jgi:GTP-binding protein